MMVAYSFNKRFVPAIVSGVKQGTIRAPRLGTHGHAARGQEVQIYTGLRTKHARLIGRATCVANVPVVLGLRAGIVYFPEATESLTSLDDLALFARRDGFASWDDLVTFWGGTHPGLSEFSGRLIQWGDTFRPATIAHAA